MPNAVSGRVVNTRILRSGRPATGRSNSAPSLRPIQLRCIVMTRSGQPGSRSHHSSSSSAYAVILKNQPSISRGVTSEIDGWFFKITAYAEERSEEHTSELQSRSDLVCRLLLEKKNKTIHV